MKDKVTIYYDDGTPVDVSYEALVRTFIAGIEAKFSSEHVCKCNHGGCCGSEEEED